MNSKTGVGFCGLLTILFIALKLLGKITWSWVWVLSPIWIYAIIMFAVIWLLAKAEAKRESWRYRK